MIYRDTMPPGQAHGQPYNGQHPSQNQNLQNLQPQPQQHQVSYPQYANGNGLNGYPIDGAAPYQQNQYAQPAYPQPQPQQPQQSASYYANNTAHLTNYSAPFNHTPPVDITPPLEFVNPSFLQNTVPPAPVSAVRPPPVPVKVETNIHPPPPQIASVRESPKGSPTLGLKRNLSQGTSAKTSARDPKRQVTGTGVAKSPILSQSSTHVETLPLLLCIAEDCFSQASSAVRDVAKHMTAADVNQHHKLVATGLGCLEIALKSNKLPPRLEARLCLRYASILTEETANLMEAETALTRGMAVCEKHRFPDLKYSTQFLLMKTLFQRNQKAAFKSIDGHINDCTTYKHVHWIYAFRFLKAAFHLQSGTAADIHALENLRKIAFIAQQRGEKAIFVIATLLEGLAHLSTAKDDWITRVQTCIAQASKLQLDESVHLPQIDVLLLLLDLACSLRQKSHAMSGQKIGVLQKKMDELRVSPEWASNEILLPIGRSTTSPQIISNDTRAILRPGNDGTDYLVLSALGKHETYALACVFSGIGAHYNSTTVGRNSTFWNEAVKLLEDTKFTSTSNSLPEALKHSDWAKGLSGYAQVLLGLQAATLCDWAKVKRCLEAIKDSNPSAEFLDIMTLYLTGVFYQGTADLAAALVIWTDKRFELDGRKPPKSRVQYELSILAALNRLWMMQEPSHQSDAQTAEIMELLRPLCENNPDREIETAYNLVLASCRLNPPLSINQIKSHIQNSLSGAQQTRNTQCLSIALNTMRCRLFENVVGEQALKSARAASAQAKKSGNILWMSVADGMLAQSFEMQGDLENARTTRALGVQLANEARDKTMC